MIQTRSLKAWSGIPSISLLLILIFSAIHFGPFVLAAEQLSQPNILFIIADDASRDSFGAYGSTYVETPNFDRIAREGVKFTQAYNCNPKCAPARACVLTGRYSWQLEEACNHNPFLSDKWVFYPFLLEEAGYFIGYTGKGWGPGIHAGVDAGKSSFSNVNPAGRPYQDNRLKPPFQGISNTDYGANFEDFLDAKPADRPFCFWLGTREPHRGYEKDSWKKQGRDLSRVVVPDYYPDNEVIRGDLADYAIEVEWYDKWIGEALESLESRGLLDNTLILVTSDHGMPFPRVKGQIYDDGFHVPFVARWGKRIKPGRVVTDFVTFPDIAPTLMELAGLSPHPQMTGKSFATQLLSDASGRIDSQRDHTLLGKERHDIGRTDGDLLSVSYPARAIRTDQFLYVRNFKPDRWPVGNPEFDFLNCDNSPTKSYLTELSQIHPDYRYFELSFGKRPEEELYDVQADPDCVHNLAESRQYQTIKLLLWQQLRDELTAQGDPRMLGQGEIFDFYPNCRVERQQQLYGRPDYDPVKIFQEKYGSPSTDAAGSVIAPQNQRKVKPSNSSDGFSCKESDATISLYRGDQLLLTYNKQPPPLPAGIDPIYRRSGFLHPVQTPAGKTVTATYPIDHAHQHGIFTAWVRTSYDGKPVDFWNLAEGTGLVRHDRVLTSSSSFEALPGFTVTLTHSALLDHSAVADEESTKTATGRSEQPGANRIDVLQETWKVNLVHADDDYMAFDIDLEQQALTDKPLIIEQYHYGGVALRGPVDWIVDANAGEAASSYFLNDRGSNRIDGNHEHARWVALTGMVDGQPATIAVLSHEDNFRAPQAARLHPTKPYFCFAPCVDGEFVIDKQHPYRGRYRYLVTDQPSQSEWIEARWQAWMKEEK